MASLLFKDLPDLITDNEDDRLFYTNWLMKQGSPDTEQPTEEDRKRLAATRTPEALAKHPENALGGDLPPPPDGFSRVADSSPKPPSGFQKVSDTQPLPPSGFKKVADTSPDEPPPGFKKVGDESSPKEKSTLENWKDAISAMAEDAIGSGKALVNMGAGLVNMPGSWGTGLGAELSGADDKQAELVRQQYIQSRTPFSNGPGLHLGSAPNPENPVSAAMGQFGDMIHGVTNTAFNPMGAVNSLMGGEDLPNNEDPSLAKGMTEDMLTLMTGGRAAEAQKGPATIEGSARRIPEDTPQLPPPVEPPAPQGPAAPPPLAPKAAPADLVKEQQASSATANQTLLDMYNNRDQGNANANYGVDEREQMNHGDIESGASNPFFRGGAIFTDPALGHDPQTGYMVLNDAFKLQDAVEENPKGKETYTASREPDIRTLGNNLDLEVDEARKPPTTQELQKMRELGDQVIQKIEQEGLTPSQIVNQFRETTYKELPAEVKERFDILEQKAGRTGDLVPSIKASDFSGMQRYQLALMYLANNYAWGPKSAGSLENIIDMKDLSDPNIQEQRRMRDYNDIFMGHNPNDQKDYLSVLRQNSKGGSLNHVLIFIAGKSADPMERMLARALYDPSNQMTLHIDEEHGSTRYGYAASRAGMPGAVHLVIDPSDQFGGFGGLSTITVLHEALHARLKKIIELGRDSRTAPHYPEYARFADELGTLWQSIYKSLPKETQNAWRAPFFGASENQGSQGHELISWGLTYPAFIRILKHTYVTKDGKSAWHHLNGLIAEDMLSKGFKFTGGKYQEKAIKELADMNETAAKYDTDAYQELLNLVMPILQATKGVKHSPIDEKTVLNALDGWWKNNEVFDQLKPQKGPDLEVDQAEMDYGGEANHLKKLFDRYIGKTGDILTLAEDRVINIAESGMKPQPAGLPEGTKVRLLKVDVQSGSYEDYILIHGKIISTPDEEHEHLEGYTFDWNPTDFKEIKKHWDSDTDMLTVEDLVNSVSPKGFGDTYVRDPFLDKYKDLDADEAIRKDLPVPKLNQFMISPYQTYMDLQQDILGRYTDFSDINRVSAAFHPATMVKNTQNNPVATFGVTKLREVFGAKHVLDRLLVQTVKPFTKANKDVKLRIVNTLNQMNRPENQAILQQQRANHAGPDWWKNESLLKATDAELTHYGMHESDIPLYRKTLEPLFQTLLRIDRAMLQKAFGRALISDVVGYFPRSFGSGKFEVKGINSNSELVFYHRVPTFVQQMKLKQELEKSGLYVATGVSPDWADYKTHLMALVDINPHNFTSKAAQNALNASEEWKRTQEYERSVHNLAGFIGQNINKPKEVDRLIQQIFNRIKMSTDTYVAARIISEILRPLQRDIITSSMWPNARKYIADLVAYALGGDISKLAWIDNGAQMMLETGYKMFLKASPYRKDIARMINPKVLTPGAARELSRFVAAFGSMWALTMNVMNMLQNFSAIPLVSILGGIPDAKKLGASTARIIPASFAAHIESVWDLVSLMFGKGDPQVRKFITHASQRGQIIARAFGDLKEMRNLDVGPFEKAAAKVLSAPKVLFNDPIEIATNFMSLLYYNRLVRILKPNLSKETHYLTVVEYTKRYTGEYQQWNKPLGYAKAGVIGGASANFVIWMHTKVGQIHELIKDHGRKSFLPFYILLISSILTAGIKGMPGAQDYENIRQWPLTQVIFDGTEADPLPPLDWKLKQVGVPEWLRNGILLNSTGIDLAGRGKWSGFTDYGAVAFQLPQDIYSISVYVVKSMEEHNPKKGSDSPQGPSMRQKGAFVQALPAGAAGFARNSLMTNHLTNTPMVMSSRGNALYSQKPERTGIFHMTDREYNALNGRTPRQSEEAADQYGKLYDVKVFTKKKADLHRQIIEQIVNTLNSQREGDKEAADRHMKAYEVDLGNYAKLDPSNESWNNINAEIQKEIFKRTQPAREATVRELASGSNDMGRKLMLLKILKTIDKGRGTNQ